MVKIRFVDKDNRILPEMSAKVAFLSRPVTAEDQKPRTAMNQAALVAQKDKKIVFVVKENKTVEIPVTLGATIGDMIEVLDGVKAGEQVVLNPSSRLRNGYRIKVAEK
jgi:multidrug efflux pump subunit AcrA (membrane-fusion protein)